MMANKMVKISVSQVLIIKVSPTDIIDGLPVNYKGTIRVLHGGVDAESYRAQIQL